MAGPTIHDDPRRWTAAQAVEALWRTLVWWEAVWPDMLQADVATKRAVVTETFYRMLGAVLEGEASPVIDVAPD